MRTTSGKNSCTAAAAWTPKMLSFLVLRTTTTLPAWCTYSYGTLFNAYPFSRRFEDFSFSRTKLCASIFMPISGRKEVEELFNCVFAVSGNVSVLHGFLHEIFGLLHNIKSRRLPMVPLTCFVITAYSVLNRLSLAYSLNNVLYHVSCTSFSIVSLRTL